MVDILKPPLVWINGSCYRKNVETDFTPTRGYTGEDEPYDDLDDEVPEDEADSFQHVIEEISGGRYKASLQIASSFFPQIIGKGGQTKTRLEMDTRTKILIPRKGQEGDIVITGSDRRGVINASNRIDVIVAAARNKMSFTHFISLPVNTQPIQESFMKFRQEVLENCSDVRGVDETIFQTPTLLHLTLGTMALLDERERDLARNLMQDCKEKVLLPLLGGKPLKFSVCGLEYMNDDPAEVDVLYAKVKDEDGTLQAVADGIVDHFIESGLMTRQYDRVKLHVTLINTIFRKDAGDLGDKNDQMERESFDSRSIFEGWRDVSLGDVQVNEVHLSQRRAGRRTKEGYYLPSCVVSLVSCG